MFIITKPNSKIRLPGHGPRTLTYQQNWNYTKIKSFHYWKYDINNTQLPESLVCTLESYGLRAMPWTSCLNFSRLASIELQFYNNTAECHSQNACARIVTATLYSPLLQEPRNGWRQIQGVLTWLAEKKQY